MHQVGDEVEDLIDGRINLRLRFKNGILHIDWRSSLDLLFENRVPNLGDTINSDPNGDQALTICRTSSSR